MGLGLGLGLGLGEGCHPAHQVLTLTLSLTRSSMPTTGTESVNTRLVASSEAVCRLWFIEHTNLVRARVRLSG